MEIELSERSQRLGSSDSQLKPAKQKQPSSLPRLIKLATRQDQCLYLLGLLCSIGSGTILPLMTLIFGNFVTVFSGFALGQISNNEFVSEISNRTLYFIYLFIAKLGLSYSSMVLFTIVSTNVTSAIQKRYLHAALNQRIAFHETELRAGAVTEALSNHSNTIRSGLADKFGMTAQNASTVVAAFIVATTSIWNLSLAVATVIPASVLVIGAVSVADEKLEKQINGLKEEASTVAEEVFSSIKTVRALGATQKLFAIYTSYLDRATKVGWKRSPLYGLQVGTYMFLLYSAYALAFWYGIRLYAQGHVAQPGKVITTLFSIMIGINSFSQLAAYLGDFMSIASSVHAMFKMIDAPVAGKGLSGDNLDSAFNSFDSGDASLSKIFNRDIQMNNVSFRYPTRPGVSVLSSLSLTIEGGKKTALVGQSGCGKSTIVGLLMRWYDTEAGSVTIGERKIDSMPMRILRTNIGLVQQEPQLFSGTILENVAFGLLGSPLNNVSPADKEDLVIKACKLAGAHAFISQLPEGYYTPVGDRGGQLSGGQRQRLAIARAIIKNPSILIFDEATSALDMASEATVLRAIENASQGRTVISIAHRLATVQNCDQIYVLGNGGLIIEQGTHASLTSKEEGLYKRLWEIQSVQHKEARMSAGINTQAMEPGSTEMLEQNLKDGDEKRDMEYGSAKEDTKSIKGSRKGLFKTLMPVLSRFRAYWIFFLIWGFCSCISGALYPIQAILYAKAVDAFQKTGATLTSAGNFWGLMWFILALIVAVGYTGQSIIGMGMGEKIAQDYRASYFNSIAHQPIAYFDEETHSPSRLMASVSTEPESINKLVGSNFSVIITVSVALISTTALALATGWKFALVVLAGGLPVIFAANFVRERMENTFEENAGKLFTECIGYAGECIHAIRTVVSLNMEDYVENRFGDLLSTHRKRAYRHALLGMVWFALSEAVDLLCMALAFWYGGKLLAYDGYSTEQFFVVFIAIVFGSQSAGSYFAHSSDITKGVTAVNTIKDMERSVQTSNVFRGRAGIGHGLQDLVSGDDAPLFEFRNVNFAYPERPEHHVLQDFNLKVYPGQFVAIVGESGSGKSTCTELLERFYLPHSGDILVHGADIADLPEETIHDTLSLVSQEPTLYQGTVKDNLLLGTSADIPQMTLDETIEACRLTDLISSLPEGYNTSVGARGTALSGGQRQRLAIARALLRDRPILLLDEATSALDSESERLIQDALMKRCAANKQGAMLAIAHRLSTVRNADVIYVMSKGRVVEVGSHEELLARKGWYYGLWQTSETGRKAA